LGADSRGVYSRLKLNKPKAKEGWEKKKRNRLYLKQVLSEILKPYNNQKLFNSGRARSFGTAPGPIL